MLGAIRFILAAMVVLAHTSGYPHGAWPDPGLPAVIGFFFLSGVLMPAAFDRNYAAGSFSEQAARFTFNRLLKIFPLYWLSLAVAIWLNWRAHGWEFAYAIGHPWTFVQNGLLLGLNQVEFWGKDVRFIGPAWTLDIELQFYLLVPLLVWLSRRWPRASAWILAALSLLSLALLMRPAGVTGVDKSLLPWFCCFGAGFLLQRLRPSILNMASRGSGVGFVLLGDLSYPLYLIHRPMLEIELGTRLVARAVQPGLALVFVSNLLVASATALLIHVLAARGIETIRSRVRRGSLFPGTRPLPQDISEKPLAGGLRQAA